MNDKEFYVSPEFDTPVTFVWGGVYELFAINFIDRENDTTCRTERVYLGLYSDEIGVDKAIRAAVTHAAAGGWPRDIVAFYVYERGLDPEHAGIAEEIARYLSVRSYFANGILNTISEYDNACFKSFIGREKGAIRYKEGDVVWVSNRKDRLRKGVISALPMTKEEYKERFGEKTGLFDYTDDAYTVEFGGDDHAHPCASDVFPYAIDAVMTLHEIAERARLAGDFFRAQNKSLSANMDWFYANLEKLLPLYKGRYIAFADGKIISVTDDFVEAAKQAIAAGHEMGTFAVRHCVPKDEDVVRVYSVNSK